MAHKRTYINFAVGIIGVDSPSLYEKLAICIGEEKCFGTGSTAVGSKVVVSSSQMEPIQGDQRQKHEEENK